MKTLMLAAALTLIAVPASAQVFVNGEGNAHSCYMSTKTGDMGSLGAIRVCSDALRDGLTRTDKAATYVNRGVLQMRGASYASAVEDYEAAIAIIPELDEAYINYGAALFYLNRDADAMAALNTAIEMDTPKMAIALYNRALVHDRAGDARRAYFDLRKALELEPEFAAAQNAITRYTVTRNAS